MNNRRYYTADEEGYSSNVYSINDGKYLDSELFLISHQILLEPGSDDQQLGLMNHNIRCNSTDSYMEV